MSFQQRSYQKELLDELHIPFADIKQNMQELDTINHRLGGHRITLKGMQKLVENFSSLDEPLFVVEIGCGGGDNLRVIKQWADGNGMSVQLTGVDINPECIAYAREQIGNRGIHFICSDFRQVSFSPQPHIIFSSLFCHHFTEDAIIQMLQWQMEQSTVGFFINDLHRHPAAYHSIKWITRLFSKSYLVKNDAPLSVKRGFVKSEWKELLVSAGINNYSINWQWAFRWLVIAKKQHAAQ